MAYSHLTRANPHSHIAKKYHQHKSRHEPQRSVFLPKTQRVVFHISVATIRFFPCQFIHSMSTCIPTSPIPFLCFSPFCVPQASKQASKRAPAHVFLLPDTREMFLFSLQPPKIVVKSFHHQPPLPKKMKSGRQKNQSQSKAKQKHMGRRRKRCLRSLCIMNDRHQKSRPHPNDKYHQQKN